MNFIRLPVVSKIKSRHHDDIFQVVNIVSRSIGQQAYDLLERVAELFSRIPTSFFLLIGALHVNYLIYKVIHQFFFCWLQFMLVLKVPQPWVDVAKQYSARTRELSFTRPSDWLFAYYRVYRMTERVDVVLAHYKEDLSWISPFMGKIDHLYLYCKDSASCQKGLPSDYRGAKVIIQHLPNEGREANSYLYHILHSYNHLAPRTVFSLASIKGNWMRQLSFMFSLTESQSPRKHCYSPEFFDRIRMFQFDQRASVATSLGDGYNNRAQGSTIHFAEYRPLGVWMQHYLKRDVFESHCRYGDAEHGAIFSVSRSAIHRYPRSLYRTLLKSNSGADSMEAGYFMERIWRFMYSHHERLNT